MDVSTYIKIDHTLEEVYMFLFAIVSLGVSFLVLCKRDTKHSYFHSFLIHFDFYEWITEEEMRVRDILD